MRHVCFVGSQQMVQRDKLISNRIRFLFGLDIQIQLNVLHPTILLRLRLLNRMNPKSNYLMEEC